MEFERGLILLMVFSKEIHILHCCFVNISIKRSETSLVLMLL